MVVSLEWARALAARAHPEAAVPILLVGGLLLYLPALGVRPARLGLGASGLPLRVLGGLALAAALLLPAAVRWTGAPMLTGEVALAAIAVSIGEEIAFRGLLYSVLEEWAGPAVAVAGSALAFAAGHLVSHPPAFLLGVLAAGLLLGLWRWACHDLVGPIIGHLLADLAL